MRPPDLDRAQALRSSGGDEERACRLQSQSLERSAGKTNPLEQSFLLGSIQHHSNGRVDLDQQPVAFPKEASLPFVGERSLWVGEFGEN